MRVFRAAVGVRGSRLGRFVTNNRGELGIDTRGERPRQSTAMQNFASIASSFTPSRVRRLSGGVVLSFALSLGACSGNDTTELVLVESPAEPPPAPPEPAPAVSGPYMGAVSVSSPGAEWASYTSVIDAVDEATEISTRAGYETPAWIAPSAHEGAVYIPAGSSPSISKFTTNDRNELIPAGTISFAAHGVSTIFQGPVKGRNLLSEDKAYYFDGANQQVIVWNPSTMELTGTVIDLSSVLGEIEEQNPGYVADIQGNFSGRQRGDRLFVPVRWSYWTAPAGTPQFLPLAGMLVIDTERDEVVRLLTDDRLADTIYTVMPRDSEDIYLFTGALGVSAHAVTGLGRPGGALVVRNGEERFDPDFYIDLEEVVGDRPASTPVWAGGTSVYLKAYHFEQLPLTPEVMAQPTSLIGQEAWRYWKVDLAGNEPAREITEVPWTTTDGFFYELPDEDRLFIGVLGAMYSRTALYEVTDRGFIPTIEVPGVLQAVSPLFREQ
jgi:hypothetical protein